MKRLFVISLVLLSPFAIATAQNRPGTAEKLGEQIDRGLSQLGAELSEAWSEVRRGVDKMGIEARVYGRLHWDKALEGAKLDIAVRDGKSVVLTGSVASDAARAKAEELARDTVGVASVINQLAVAQSTP
jgi:predicted kinase